MRKLSVSSDEGFVSPNIIRNFATDVGIVFPKSYISIISKHDYLYPKEKIFNFINVYNEKDERDIVFLGYKNELGYEDIYSYSCIDDDYSYGKKVIAFGLCANGDYVCFDYRKGRENPSVVVMYHDDFYEDENGDTKMVVNYVADNFDDFLEML
ncbi:SMI1/KNR4 family protein, partial [Neisseria dentiae]